MTIADSKQEKDSPTRTGGNIETRENEPAKRPSSGNDDDPERTGGNIETRETPPPAPPPSTDSDPDREVY